METAYQMSYILNVVKRGTAKTRSLKVPLAGKTGTTNKNFDAWFIGFHQIWYSVYIGFDNPKTLGNLKLDQKQLYRFSKNL